MIRPEYPPAAAVSADVIARIRAYRIGRRMSAQKLADAITAAGYPITRAVISNQETGRVGTIPVDLVVAAAQVFGLSIAEMFEGGPCPTCAGRPPAGFTCKACGTEADR
ncbi:helix-turn-helix domain-containing protein [Streptomyces sp. NBC_01808]|uniref:helix-turn-helix domain-containing protein n=1 Tax=Streptomyces sp. NBC_01808 TaxID=2975947 RepID=UPI002DD7CAC3|nr:helix-turn-helix domain-containing protein [Streptomyces sp. NBC_01808]WSA39504.1 helix-turn-helix domain-containing protein [Streptomyces sp. NBC_01808]